MFYFYTLRKQKTGIFFDNFRGYRSGKLVENGLNHEIFQGRIQRPVVGRCPWQYLTKICLFFQNSILLRHIWVKLRKKCPFYEDSGHCPKILDYTL